ncbi:PH domain-containing protein [Carnobacterium antarcticum]|uniref:PH domain-containing protein n=1 Tax=Carnobacterium antarcticum TaxID=2126436 RepID=A0ABW4NNH4_9LACT|nr:PH domain-containing protein [Carnobacterium sp. CP1]ALV20717.1 Phage protein [Carnobacterium sp. CP1]
MSVTYEELKKMNKNNKRGILIKKDLKKLPSIINTDETVIDFILSNIKEQALLVITSSRILFIQSKTGFGNLGSNVWDISLNKVNSVDVSLQKIYGELTIHHGSSFKKVENLPLTQVNGFKNTINQAMSNLTNKVEVTKPTSSASSFEELKKYKELLDLNIITKEEFDKKKIELLNL